MANLTDREIENKINLSTSLNTVTTGLLAVVPVLMYWAFTTFELSWWFYLAIVLTFVLLCLSFFFHGRGVALIGRGEHGASFDFQAKTLLAAFLIFVTTAIATATLGTRRVDRILQELLTVQGEVSQIQSQLKQLKSRLEGVEVRLDSLEDLLEPHALLESETTEAQNKPDQDVRPGR